MESTCERLLGVRKLLVREVRCRSMLSRSRLADYCINPYIGCQHGCIYCYADSYTRRFTEHAEAWGEFVDVKVNGPRILEREVSVKPKGTVFLSSLTDPYQPLEERYGLTRRLLETLLRYQFPISIQTKSTLILRDLDMIKKFDDREVGFTITTLNDERRRLFEPASSPVEERLNAIGRFRDSGVRTFVFYGPILPHISDRDVEQFLRRVSSAGADYVYVDRLNLKPGLWIKLERHLKDSAPHLHEEWSRILHGGTDYYNSVKVRISKTARELGLKCIFCF
ncbi:MAG: radical SAM protein [Candidatus Bathyarchaeia archaeon]